jgi:superfamily II DNA/RNA helicase
LLAELLGSEPIDRALVFTRTKHGADRVVRSLQSAGITAAAIHGNKSQGQRERVLADFREGRVRTLIATDIAARGIDVDGISHVINYDVPNIPESYVHRIGRTARAGAAGVAISFCDADEAPFLRDIERLIRAPIPATDRRRPGHATTHDQKRSQHHRGGHGQRGHHGQRTRGGNGPSHSSRPDNRGHHAERPRPTGQAPAPAESGTHQGIGGVAFLNRKQDHRRGAGNGNRRPAR